MWIIYDQSSSSINSNNSSTTNNSSNQKTSNDDFIDANLNQNATSIEWNNTTLNKALNGNSLNTVMSVWQLPEKAKNYNISLSKANYQSYQWYQIPFSVFFNQITAYIANSTSESFKSLLSNIIQNSNEISNASYATYVFKYNESLKDAFYVCKVQSNDKTYYSKIIWLQESTVPNPNGVNGYNITYQYNQYNSDTYDYQPSKGNEIIVAPWNTNLSFSTSITKSNNGSLSWNDYYMVWQAGSYYSSVMSMANSTSYQYIFNCTNETTNVDILIFNSNGQIIKTNNLGINYTINVIDPLQIENSTYSLATNSSTTPISYNGKSYNDVVVDNNSPLTFSLSINGLTAKSFKNYDYTVVYSLIPTENYENENNDNSMNSLPLELSESSSWKYSFSNIPDGIWNVAVQIIGPTQNDISINSNSNYQIVKSYVEISPTYSNTSYNQSNSLSVKYAACIWQEVTYEWQSSSNQGKTWTTLITNTVNNNSSYWNLSTISDYSFQTAYQSEEYRLIVSNASGIYSTITSNVVNLTQTLLTPVISFNNSIYQTQYNSYTMAFASISANTINLKLSFTQFGNQIAINSSILNGLDIDVTAYQGYDSTDDSIYNDQSVSTFYNASNNSIIIPIQSSNLINNYTTEYYGDGNNPVQSPIQLYVTLYQNNQSTNSNTLQVQFLSISYTGDDAAGNGVGTITIDGNQQNSTSYSSFDSSLNNYDGTLYYEWQKSTNGSNWTNVHSLSYQGLTTSVITQDVYYRLIVYASKNEEIFTSSNVITFQYY